MKELFSATYRKRRTYMKYDSENIIVYANERVVQDPEDETQSLYEYTGTERDGGTVVKAIDTTDVGEVANALIRIRYTESNENAIHRHHMLLLADPTIPKADEYTEEWNEYNAYAVQCVETAKQWVEE